MKITSKYHLKVNEQSCLKEELGVFGSSNFVDNPGIISFALFFCKLNFHLISTDKYNLPISI